MPIIAFFTWFLWVIPFATGSLARRIGRPFWFWFVMGCILPIVSGLVLFCLPEKPQPAAE